MKHLLRIFSVCVAVTCCAGTAIQADEAAARKWLASRGSAPNGDELAELKGENPEAYALVKALLTKQAMGLIKRKSHSGSSEIPDSPPPALPISSLPEPPALEAYPMTPASHEVIAQGPPAIPANYDAEAVPQELAPIAKGQYRGSGAIQRLGVPPLPPPPPISSDLPPPIVDPSVSLGPAPAAAYSGVDRFQILGGVPTVQDSDSQTPSYKVVPQPVTRFSAAATSSSISGGHNWLNWRPDQQIAENERMVQNVLGAVAQLTGKSGHSARQGDKGKPDSPLYKDEVSDILPMENPRPVATTPRKVQAAMKASKAKAAEPAAAPTQSAADLYLSSEVSEPSARPQEADDNIAGHLPETVGWNDPYKTTAAAESTASSQQNSYLKDIDLGVPQVRIPPRAAASDDNPYLKGLDLMGDGGPTESSSSATSLRAAMPSKAQLLTSHRLLSSEVDWDNDTPTSKKGKSSKLAKDHLKGFLHPATNQKSSPPAAMVSKNAYLAKLDDSTSAQAAAPSSTTEHTNAYLTSLDAQPPSATAAVDANLDLRAPAPAQREKLSDFKWDDDQASKPVQKLHELSMTSSKSAVQQVQSSKKAAKSAKKSSVVLSGWLGGSSPKVDIRAQRLQQAIAQRVADAKNPYLKGLDLDNDIDFSKQAPPKKQVNPYLASLN